MFEHFSIRFDRFFGAKIGDAGAAAVGRMLAVNTTLKLLLYDTTHNTVLSTGVWTVANVILTVCVCGECNISISGNGITGVGAKALCEGLAANTATALKYLEYVYPCIAVLLLC